LSLSCVTALMMQAPKIAGRTTTVGDEGADKCLYISEVPTTPDGVRKYRKSYFAEAGTHVIHPGLIDDVKGIDRNAKFGKTTAHSDHVENVFGHGPQTDFEDYQNDKLEGTYQSKKREPLGKSYSRGHRLPDQTKDTKFSFGVPTQSSESSKNLIYPRVENDESVHKAMYTKSHGSYAPGEQRDRGYKWNETGKDPNVFQFGKVEKNTIQNGVSLCMNPGMDDGVAKTRISAKQVEDMKDLKKEHLGRCKSMNQGGRNLKQGHVFGVAGSLDAWDAQACIQGNYSDAEQMPDEDLGTSATPGWRNVSVETRSFGAPSVRNDIKRLNVKSIADNQNYGDDVNAQFLLYPPQFAYSGVEDEDFLQARSQEEIREMFESIGYKLEDETFAAIWMHAAKYTDHNADGVVSVEEFRSALNSYLDAKDDGDEALALWLRRTRK